MPTTDLRKFQFGQETTWGTAVAATARLMGVTSATIRPVTETQSVPDIGNIAPSAREHLVKVGAEGKAEIVASYEDVLYFLCGLFGAVAPTGSSPYTWTFAAPSTSMPSPKPFTLEYGESSSAYKMAGAIAAKLGFKLEVGKLWAMTAEYIGKSVSSVTLANLSDRTVEAVRVGDTKVYMDAWGGTMGTTEVQGTLISYDLTVDAGYHTKDFITGLLTPYSYGGRRWSGSLKTTMEFNANAKALVDSLLTPALVQRQIEVEATSDTKSLTVQFCGTMTKGVELFSDRNGNMTVALEWTPTYNITFGNWLKVIAVNAVSALT